MSNIVVSTMMSIDGYTEGRDGDVYAMPVDEAFDEHNADRVRAAGHLLFGGTSFRGMGDFWPHQVDNPDANPHDRYIASRYADGIPITVVSDSLTREDVRVWSKQTTIVRRTEAHDAVARLRERDDERDVLIFGSRTLWTDLLAHGLIDELYLMIGPKIVAGDHHAFIGVPETNLRLRDVRTWKDSGSVVLHYAVGATE
ncbi:deaminase [Cellulosimicrobium funkei]|nr:deaminase [Cellulosimicrobium funkei]